MCSPLTPFETWSCVAPIWWHAFQFPPTYRCFHQNSYKPVGRCGKPSTALSRLQVWLTIKTNISSWNTYHYTCAHLCRWCASTLQKTISFGTYAKLWLIRLLLFFCMVFLVCATGVNLCDATQPACVGLHTALLKKVIHQYTNVPG